MSNNEFIAERILSHGTTSENLDSTISKLKKRICAEGNKPYATIERQLYFVDKLAEFGLGRFLLQNKGLNGYWTHYVLTHPWFGRKTRVNEEGNPLNEVETFLLDHSPIALAGQQRFNIFLQENQRRVINGNSLACIPCGMMGELFYLDYSTVKNISLVGIDLDPQTIKDAEKLAQEKNLLPQITFLIKDAWKLGIKNEFDLISSNGLNIYEHDDEKVVDLYHQFYKALKPNGVLVTSFMTIPPHVDPALCEWDMSKVDQSALPLQKTIVVDILEHGTTLCYRHTQQTRQQLLEAGFENIQFIFDEAHIFPTVVAKK